MSNGERRTLISRRLEELNEELEMLSAEADDIEENIVRYYKNNIDIKSIK